MRVLCGGSVNAANAAALTELHGVNGVRAGGASLKAESFLSVVKVFRKA